MVALRSLELLVREGTQPSQLACPVYPPAEAEADWRRTVASESLAVCEARVSELAVCSEREAPQASSSGEDFAWRAAGTVAGSIITLVLKKILQLVRCSCARAQRIGEEPLPPLISLDSDVEVAEERSPHRRRRQLRRVAGVIA